MAASLADGLAREGRVILGGDLAFVGGDGYVAGASKFRKIVGIQVKK